MIVHWSSLTHNSPGVTAANSGTTTARNTNNRTGPAALLATPHSLSNPDCRQHGCCCRHEPLEPSRDTVVQCNSTRLAWCSCCCCGVKYSKKFADVFFLLFATNNESNKYPLRSVVLFLDSAPWSRLFPRAWTRSIVSTRKPTLDNTTFNSRGASIFDFRTIFLLFELIYNLPLLIEGGLLK